MPKPQKRNQSQLDLFAGQAQAGATKHYDPLGSRQRRIRQYARLSILRFRNQRRSDRCSALLRHCVANLGGLAAPW